jgi:hypothetical protein
MPRSPGQQLDARGRLVRGDSDAAWGSHRPVESIELHNAIRENNPDPEGRDRRMSRSPASGTGSASEGRTHPYESGYGQGGASTSTVHLNHPRFDDEREREGSPFSDAAEERDDGRPISGRFREGR